MLRSKVFSVIISIVTALILWIYVIYTLEPVGTRVFTNVPVHIVNEEALNERGLAIINEDGASANIKVKGKRTELSQMEKKDVEMTADVSDCVVGDNVIEVNVKLPDQIRRTSDTTMTVHVYVDEIVTATKSVVAEYKGKNEKMTYELAGPASVEVSGARQTVDTVDHVAAVIKDESIPESEEVSSVELIPVTASGDKVDRVTLSEEKARVIIYATGTKEVALVVKTIGEPADGYSYQGLDGTATIIIKGSKKALDKIASIECEEVDITDLKGDKEIELKPILPDGIAMASGQKLSATVHIGKEADTASLTLSTDDIMIRGLDAGLTAEIEKEDITVSGEEKFTADDIQLSIDLKGYGEGFYVVPIEVETDNGIDVALSKEKVSVNISKER